MTKKASLQLFEKKKVRTVWDDKEEKWYFLHCGSDGKLRMTDVADTEQLFPHHTVDSFTEGRTIQGMDGTGGKHSYGTDAGPGKEHRPGLR